MCCRQRPNWPTAPRHLRCPHWRFPTCSASSHCARRPPALPLQALADACVAHLDPFRAPPSEAELARRRRGGLTRNRTRCCCVGAILYVFETWFFHMTLTRRLTAAEKAIYQPAAEQYFARAIAVPRQVSDICLFVQPAPGESFVIAERLKLRG